MTNQGRILRLREVEARCGLRRSSIYALGSAGVFPTPIKLSERASGWLESEIEQWLAERIAASRGKEAL